MKKVTKGLVAGALGIGLLSGGTTFALWDDDAAVAGARITAGNLDIAAVEESRVWHDVSADVEGTPEIDPETFRMVPGDTIQLTQQVKIELEGDNLHARATVDIPGLVDGGLSEYLTGDYDISWASGQVAQGSVNGESRSFAIDPAGTGGSTENQELYTVKIRLTFDPSAQDQAGVTLDTLLEDMKLTLEQVRDLP